MKNAFLHLSLSPQPTAHPVRKLLHGYTTTFLLLYKSIKRCIKILHHVGYIVCTTNHFCPHSRTALKNVTNYGAATKSAIQKFLYRCTSTIPGLIGHGGIFLSILLLNGRSHVHKLCRSNFDLIPRQMWCHLVM